MEPKTALRIGFVPGVTPGKWAGRWRERHPDILLELMEYDVGLQVEILHDGRADLSFVRLPVPMDSLNVIPLYSERPVVVAARDHFVALYEDEVPLADLEDEAFLDVAGLGGAAMAVEVAASGSGIAVMPMSLARLYDRKDVIHRPVSDTPETRIGVAWLSGNDSELVEEFIGIVRGRTANSSRQPLGGSRAGTTGGKDATDGKPTGTKGARKPSSDAGKAGGRDGSNVRRSSGGSSASKSRRTGNGKSGRRGRR